MWGLKFGAWGRDLGHLGWIPGRWWGSYPVQQACRRPHPAHRPPHPQTPHPAPNPMLTHIFSPWPPFPLNRFTNATRDFKGTLDYILFTTDSLVPSASLELPDETEVRTKAIAGEWVGGRRVITFSFHLSVPLKYELE